ncbi:hypothetical protein FISHEDRAFT_50213 [Fistulina hepatica ATCC 64428]|uniref:DUF659 domain-containing protein n=1 Tax=Fistulina hepatica ATCC 64428 TaxID=1128425 RepID=A0A0D7A2I5_9AGAR|nr:hypothetical protein FISHEDRAFT_50213 [Fistulina hepatica ATCC 64428]
MEVREATGESHTSSWISDFALSVVDQIGRSHFGAFVSDSTGNTRLARQLLTAADVVPTALDLADVVHHLNAVVKNLAQIQHFEKLVHLTRTVTTRFNTSHACKHELRNARKVLGITRGLEPVGKTRFAGIIKSARSVQRCTPALELIVSRNQCNIEGIEEFFQVHPSTKRPTRAATHFQEELDDFLALTLPIAKILTCLEANFVTLADVFVAWHACLREIDIVLEQDDHLFPLHVKEATIDVLNYRYSELFCEGGRLYSPAYLAATYLHPGKSVVFA